MAAPMGDFDAAVRRAALEAFLPARLIRPWKLLARPEQVPPPDDDDWLVWLFLAGRGAGKTRSAAEVVCEWAEDNPGCRIALVGRTPADVRDVMIEGESGILACSDDEHRPIYEPTKRRLTWPNGSIAIAYSAKVPEQLRGPQHHFAWADEAAAWHDARKGDSLDTSWNNLMLGLRLGQSPRCLVTTTPKPNKLTRDILGRRSTRVTRGTTYDNLANLAPAFREQVLAAYEGTRIGRQELQGELLDDVEGALWGLAMIDDHRLLPDPSGAFELPDMRRVIVGVDPSGGKEAGNDEQGIVVAALGVNGEFYVLADRSCKLSPHGWGSRAVKAYRDWEGDKIVAEKNFGGEMVLSTIRNVDKTVPVKLVSASRGKAVRAEPVAALYEQGLVHHVGSFPKLEDELTTWTPFDDDSPNRLDALVWAITELAGGSGQGHAFLTHWKRMQEAQQQSGEGTPAPRPVRQSARNWREIAQQIKQERERGTRPRTREDGQHG